MAPLGRRRGFELLLKHFTWLVYAETLVLLGVKVATHMWAEAGLAAIIITMLTVNIVDDERRGLGN